MVTSGIFGNKGGINMVFPFEREAEQGAPMPDGLDLPDQCAYQFLANMYSRIRSGNIDKAQAIKEKGKMTYRHAIAKKILTQSSVMGKYWADLRRDIEQINIQYVKNPTIENAYKLSSALDGRICKRSEVQNVEGN